MAKKFLNPILPGGLLSPLSGVDELTADEETLIEHLQAGDGMSEVPGGTVDGANKTFTLSLSPSPAASLQFYVNGQLAKAGGEDYTLSAGSQIDTVTAPPTGSILLANYMVDTDT